MKITHTGTSFLFKSEDGSNYQVTFTGKGAAGRILINYNKGSNSIKKTIPSKGVSATKVNAEKLVKEYEKEINE